MSLLLSPMAKNSSAGFYNGVATTSARFDLGSSAKLSFTPSAGNTRTWTWSGWIKLSSLNAGSDRIIFGQKDTYISTYQHRFWLNLRPSTSSYYLVLNRLIRDSSAWYHVVVAIDTTQAAAANRVKWYINGVHDQTYLSGYANAGAGVAQDFETSVNANLVHSIGAYNNSSNFWDGYLADVNFIDGTAYGADSFGELKNGVWIPIEPNVTYGQNGFRLKFDQVGVGTASTSTIGADTSGNNNHYTSSGIVASDCAMPNSPENNFCTFNPLWYPVGTLSEGNLKFIPATSSDTGTVSNFVPTAKSYWEVYIVSGIAGNTYVGLIQASATSNNYNTSSADWVISYGSGLYRKYGTATTGQTTWGADDILGLAYDTENTTLYVYKNNVLISTITGLNDVEHYALFAGNSTSEAEVANFGQDSSFAGNATAQGNTDGNGIGDFYYAPPSGYLALCTSNLPEPTIGPNSDTQADDHFNIVPYTGSGSSPNAITGVGFQPDWVWIKKRAADASHAMFDSSRGVTAEGAANKAIGSNRVDVEGNGNGGLSAFGSDGFTLVDGSSGSGPRSLVNDSATYVAWNWKANGGTATATISESGDNPAAVVQANPTAGFSLITYTGTGDAGTIAHGLGAVPTMMIIKNRDVADAWAVYHGANTAAPATDYLVLNTTAATADAATYWADTAPTSSVFTVHDAHSVNANGEAYVAYVFAEVEGYSKFGSYTGNGSADGTFVYTGFRPAYVMFKITNTTGDWNIYDSARSTSNIVALKLRGTASGAEITSSDDFDILSNGFKLRDAGAGLNGSGNTYIYMAFAEAPFKYANAR